MDAEAAVARRGAGAFVGRELHALVLAASLREAAAVPQALAGFAARRSPRTGWVRAQTHRRDRTRGLPPALRNLTLRAFGQRIFHSQYAPLRSDC